MLPMQVPFDPQSNPKNRFKRSRDDHSETSASDGAGKAFPTVKAVSILEAIATARRPLGISEFGVLLGIPKATAHRIAHMLEDEGLLQREPGSNRYVPGARLERLGLDIVAASMSRAPRHAILQ
jgi:IclR family acetate operon transcriptional repressor